MASALIYLVIIGMWVAYFLPRWINNRDHANQSGDKFRNAIKMVSDEFSVAPAKPDKEIRKKQLRNRRVSFLSILAIFIITTALAITSVTSAIIELIPLSGFFIYLVSVRRQKIANQLRERRLKVITQITQATIATSEEFVFDNERIEKSFFKFESEIESNIESKFESPKLSIRESMDPSGVTVVPQGTSTVRNDESPSWKPIQVPTPTYLQASKAITPKRTIDLTNNSKKLLSQNEEVDQYLAEQEVLPERRDSFEIELNKESAKPHNQAAGQ